MAKRKPKNTQGASNDGFWATHKKQAKLSFQELLRRPLGNMLTLAVIAMSLTLPSSMYLIGKNLTIVASKWQAPSQVSLYLQQDVAETKVQTSDEASETALAADTEVKAPTITIAGDTNNDGVYNVSI